jgi:hypothetical protein
MNKVLIQIWEESIREVGTRPDGCSLHIDNQERDRYISSVYEKRTDSKVPDEYDRVVGYPIDALIEDVLFKKLKSEKTIRIEEHSLRNLIGMEEIVVRDE